MEAKPESGERESSREGASPRRARLGGTQSHIQREQDALWQEVLSLADYVESALRQSIEAVCDGRSELVDTVRAEEREIDRWEVRIEQGCLRVLALYDLVATDLRRVVASLRVNRELEGLADIAENLAKRARKLHRDPLAAVFLPKIRSLGEVSLRVIDEGFAALRTMDTELARRVILGDNRVDQERAALIEELKRAIREHPDRVNTWLRLVNSARNLERAADHASNVAKAVVYMKEGAVLRRGRIDDLEE